MADPQGGDASSDGRRRVGTARRAAIPMVAAATSQPVAPCGACKFLRRKCVSGCIFAPHFASDQGSAKFAAVHKIFGASNVSKLLLHIPVNRRHDAVVTISYEAQARLADPVYGCVSTILALQQQVASLQAELATVQTQLMNSRYAVANALHSSPEPPQPPLQPGHLQPLHHQSMPVPTAVLQQQPAYSNNSSTTNNTNLINSCYNDHPGFDPMAAVETNNAASSDPLGFTHRPAGDDENDEEDSRSIGPAAAFASEMFRGRR